MKASEARRLIQPLDFESLMKDIEISAKSGCNKWVIPPRVYVSDDLKLKLLSLGYKICTEKSFEGLDALIIEW